MINVSSSIQSSKEQLVLTWRLRGQKGQLWCMNNKNLIRVFVYIFGIP